MGNGASQPGDTAELDQGVFEDTIFNEKEISHITKLFSEGGIQKILDSLLPMPLLDYILAWLKAQDESGGEDTNITIEQAVYLLDTLHPGQIVDSKRDLAWNLYDIDSDGQISQSDLVGVLRHILPTLPLAHHQTLARRALQPFPDNLVSRNMFSELISDRQIIQLFTRPIS